MMVNNPEYGPPLTLFSIRQTSGWLGRRTGRPGGLASQPTGFFHITAIAIAPSLGRERPVLNPFGNFAAH